MPSSDEVLDWTTAYQTYAAEPGSSQVAALQQIAQDLLATASSSTSSSSSSSSSNARPGNAWPGNTATAATAAAAAADAAATAAGSTTYCPGAINDIYGRLFGREVRRACVCACALGIFFNPVQKFIHGCYVWRS